MPGRALALLSAMSTGAGRWGALVRALRGLQRENRVRLGDKSKISRRDSVAARADFRNRRRLCRRRPPQGGGEKQQAGRFADELFMVLHLGMSVINYQHERSRNVLACGRECRKDCGGEEKGRD